MPRVLYEATTYRPAVAKWSRVPLLGGRCVLLKVHALVYARQSVPPVPMQLAQAHVQLLLALHRPQETLELGGAVELRKDTEAVTQLGSWKLK